MIWSKARFQHSFELFPRVLKEVAPFLLPLSLLLWSMEYYMSWLNKARFADPYSFSMSHMALVGILGVILQSLISVVWLLTIAASARRQSHNGQKPRAIAFVKTHFHQCLIESVRALISTGIYTLFLILPGIYRFVQLTFTPLIAAFDPDYLKGKKDALEASAHLVKGCFWPLAIFLIIMSLLPSGLEEVAKSNDLSTLGTGILYGMSWLFSLYLTIYLSLTFFARWSYKVEPS